MCQINSDPMRATVGHLEVKGVCNIQCSFDTLFYFHSILLVPPTFVQSGTSEDVSVKEGSGARLRCEAKGNPPPKVQWKREDGRQISRAAVRSSSQQRNKGRNLRAVYSLKKVLKT